MYAIFQTSNSSLKNIKAIIIVFYTDKINKLTKWVCTSSQILMEDSQKWIINFIVIINVVPGPCTSQWCRLMML